MSAEKSRGWRPGPGLLVTAAFIGPGTVTTASMAGARFGFELLWTLILAVAAAIVLQEMAARLGLVARRGLAEAIRESVRPAWARGAALGLVLTAIVLGNTAYQTGNLIGAGVGISVLTGMPEGVGAGVLGILVAAVLGFGIGSRWLHAALVAIVLMMSFAFLATAIAVRPESADLFGGAVGFRLTEGSMLTALALIGTTVVPYNLFLHATSAQKRWPAEGEVARSLREARVDTIVAITIGGLVTMAIMATAAASFFNQGSPPADLRAMARQLEPLLGSAGVGLFAAGLGAAGLTSAVTAPLAAGYAAAGSFANGSQRIVKATAVTIALVGTALAFLYGSSPKETILIAQAANGLLLPLVAAFLLVVMNRSDLLGEHRNGWLLNLAGGAVLLVALIPGGKLLYTALAS